MRLLLLLAGVMLIVAWLRARAQPRHPTAPRPTPNPSKTGAPQDMVACAHCGLLLPADDAISSAQHHYCSAAHRDAAQSAG